MKWDAFISYSHAADGRLAPAVQQGLQRLARPWYRRRALHVFRDKTGLSVNPHLWGSIQEALDDSRYFVLLISPQAAASKWVAREVEHWCTHRDPTLILPVLTDGEWAWDDAGGDFDRVRSTAVPPGLRGVFVGEPLYLDLRWAHDEGHLDLRNGRFLDAIADLAAPMHGLSRDDLVGEDVRLHRRAKRLAWSAVAALTMLTLAAGVAALAAVSFARSAEARRVEAVAQRLAVQSGQYDQPEVAFLLAAEAYRLDPGPATEGAVIGAAEAFTTAEVAAIIRPHDAPVYAVLDAADKGVLVSADGSGAISFTDRSTGEPLAEDLTVPDIVIDLFATGDTVVAAGRTSVQEWSLGDYRRLGPPYPAPATVLDADLDASGDRLAVAGTDGTVRVLNRATQMWEAPISIGDVRVSGVAWSPQGDRLAVALEDGAVGVWNLSGEALWMEPGAHLGAATAVAYSPDGSRIVSGGLLGVVVVWDAATGERLAARAVHNGSVQDVGFTRNHPLGEFIASAGSDGKIGWVDATTYAPYPDVSLHTGSINSLSFAGDGTYADGGDDGQVVFYDAARAVLIAGHRVDTGSVPLAVAAVGGGRFVAGTATGLSLFDSSGVPIGPAFAADQIGPDAGISAVGGAGDEGVLLATTAGKLVSWTFGGDIVTLVSTGTTVSGLVVDPTGTSVAMLEGSGAVSLWNVVESPARFVAPIPGQWLAATFDGSGARLALAGVDGRLIIAEAATGSIQTELGNPAELLYVTAAAFHPVLPLLAAADAAGTVRLWNTDTGEETGVIFAGHRGSVRGVGFIREGERLVTAGSDGTVRVWEAATGQPIGSPITSHYLDILAMAVADDVAVTASVDGSVLFRSLDVSHWLDEGCRLVGRGLTEQEVAQFGLDRPRDPVCE
jgi:WD40 repeat protein